MVRLLLDVIRRVVVLFPLLVYWVVAVRMRRVVDLDLRSLLVLGQGMLLGCTGLFLRTVGYRAAGNVVVAFVAVV